MAKKKRLEEDTREPESEVAEDSHSGQIEEVKEELVVDGWIIGEDVNEEGVSEPITTVETEPEGEEGWEAEAFWALLARAGYQLW